MKKKLFVKSLIATTEIHNVNCPHCLHVLTYISLVQYNAWMHWHMSHAGNTSSHVPPPTFMNIFWTRLVCWLSTRPTYLSWPLILADHDNAGAPWDDAAFDLIGPWTASEPHSDFEVFALTYINTTTTNVKLTRICEQWSIHIATCFEHGSLFLYPKPIQVFLAMGGVHLLPSNTCKEC